VREIAIAVIERSPWQTREMFSPESVAELAASIQSAGVVQPVVLRPVKEGRYQLIAGERRVAASRLIGRATVPAIVRRVSDEQAAEMTLIENLMREDLNPMEQAWAFWRLAEHFGLTQEQIAARTGKDRASIGNYLRLLKAPEPMQQALSRGELTMGHAKALLTLPPGLLTYGISRVLGSAMSVRQTERYVQNVLSPKPKVQQEEPVDPNVKAAQQQLQRALGCKVTIEDREGRGKIVIEYGSLEDFDRIVEALGK
jgi:ParB family chromosome partitioning protein